MKLTKTYLLTAFLLCMALFEGSDLWAQNKTQLQNKKKKLQKEIDYTNGLLKKNKKKQEASLQQIEKINANIETRSDLIQNYAEELNVITDEIGDHETSVTKLEKQLQLLKKNYAKMVVHAWKTRNSLGTWMFILSAKNFNQAIRRYQYYKQINELRQVQSKSITSSKYDLKQRINKLRNSKIEKENIIGEKNNEIIKLEDQKNEKDKVLKKLKKKEKELLADVKKKEKEKNKLAEKINSIIDKLPDTKKKESKTTTTTKTNDKKSDTKTETKTEISNTQGSSNSNGFENNKGKLSWPVSKGVITGKFGVHQHPVLDKVEVKNDGIDISTDNGAGVRAVYKGTVSGVFKVDGFENVVIIRHGEYLTVYSHLSTVSVSKGDEVSTDQKIGTAASDDEGNTFINFQVRYGSEVQNPTNWLTK